MRAARAAMARLTRIHMVIQEMTEIAPPGWAGMVDKVTSIQAREGLVALSVV
ncbi:Hypothetical protein, conserved [Brucella abortus str. 2308 A]|nr:Hypothetical protein, conserved [Brucella abortus str. 2308 A]ERM05883.1 hypothetical protein P408_05485 [Brucella abortus S99]ERM85018.1 hypothetical protein P865_16205 [Brucella abortus 82]